jgi:hypothetical protein
VLKTSLDKKAAEIKATLANEKALRDVPNKDNVISNLNFELTVIKGLVDKFKLV